MKYALIIHSDSAEGARTAVDFARAAITRGHEIVKVFFYHDGVQQGLAPRVVPQDEIDPLGLWRELHEEHQVPLTVCIAAALRRGVLDDQERARYERAAEPLAPQFEIAGLGQLVEAGIDADRTITFGA